MCNVGKIVFCKVNPDSKVLQPFVIGTFHQFVMIQQHTHSYTSSVYSLPSRLSHQPLFAKPFLSPFYIQLGFRATLSFKLTSKNLSFSQFRTIKVYFKTKINIFLTIMIIESLVKKKSTDTLILELVRLKKKPPLKFRILQQD